MAANPLGWPRLIRGSEQPVGGGANGAGTAIEHVRVDHGRADVLVSEKFLHRPNVVAVFQQRSMLPIARGVSRATSRMGAGVYAPSFRPYKKRKGARGAPRRAPSGGTSRRAGGGQISPQDRITKARIYATARVPEYWILNLRDNCLEVLRTIVLTNGLVNSLSVISSCAVGAPTQDEKFPPPRAMG
jgi:hypothetical protein